MYSALDKNLYFSSRLNPGYTDSHLVYKRFSFNSTDNTLCIGDKIFSCNLNSALHHAYIYVKFDLQLNCIKCTYTEI